MICLASDHGGFLYKEKLKPILTKMGFEFKDFGTLNTVRCDAIDFCAPATRQVLRKKENRGIFICRSGHAMSIISNKFSGARAVCCYSEKAVKSARAHNDINILATGADFVSFSKFVKIVKAFLKTEFIGGVYQNRIDKLNKLSMKLKAKK